MCGGCRVAYRALKKKGRVAYANTRQTAPCNCKIVNRGNCLKIITNFWLLEAIPLASYR